MGYACPVCSDPQADATHLANHLAFTALARGGDHEEWLDEHVPDWESMGEDTLGDELAGMAEEADYPQVFEDTTDQGHGHAHDHEHTHDSAGGHDPTRGMEGVSDAMLAEAEEALADEDAPDTENVLAEARELTRQRREGGGDGASDDGDSGTGGESASESESE
jgi:hypothetical protein